MKGVSGWLWLPPLGFGAVVITSVVMTDILISPTGSPYFARDPVLLAWLSIPTVFSSFLAAYLWLRKGIGFFGGWMSVAVAAWIPLLFNPAAWVLTLGTMTLYGFVVLGCLLFAGAVLQALWGCRRR